MAIMTTQGFDQAIATAVELDALNDDTDDEYSRGVVELIANTFVQSTDDPDNIRAFVQNEIRNQRLRRGY